ncbi:MAG: N-acetylmuramoyl-L-alanine amidase [Lachnospiraceae bacterium]|nr:N-acetylmuramoyl-L-alanine amidase [Lachnospiraceae bacterium]
MRKRSLRHIITYLLCISVTLSAIPHISAHAQSYLFRYKEYMNGTKINYNGTIPNYTINGVSVNTSSTPGIINSRGIAMCNATVVFKAAGVKVSYSSSKKRVTFKYNDNKLVLCMNSDRAYFNGEEIKASCESYRVKYTSSGKTVTFVPSRFVAETLGMDYTWSSSAKTASIKTPVKLGYNNEIVYYLGSLGKLRIDDEDYDNSYYPSIIMSDNAMLSADAVFDVLEDAYIDYRSKTGRITIECGDIELKMNVGSTTTYVNGIISKCPVAPVKIRNYETGTVGLYIPGRYVFETLGYKYTWLDSQKTSSIEFVEDKTGIFDKDYIIAAICDAPDPDVDDDYLQEFELELPEGFEPEEVEIKDILLENLVRIELEGDHTEFYSDLLDNTGEALLQVNVLYYPEKDVTQINMYCKTDENNIILGHKDEYDENSIIFTFDRPKNLFDKIIILDAGHGGKDPGTQHGGYDEKDMNFAVVYKYCKQFFDDSDIKVYYSRSDDTLPSLYDRAGLGARLGADLFISVHHNSNSNTSITGTSVYYSTEDEGTYPVKPEENEEDDPDGEDTLPGETASGENDNASTEDGRSDEVESDENEADVNKDSSDDYDLPEQKEYLTGKIMAKMLLEALLEKLETVNRGVIDRNFVVVGKNNSIPAVLIEIGFMSSPSELKRIVTPKFQKKAAKAIYETVLKMYEIYGD